jgi:hypothetical protein
MKEEKALWKKGLAYFSTMFIPVFPVVPVVGLHSEFNSRLELTEGLEFRLQAAFVSQAGRLKAELQTFFTLNFVPFTCRRASAKISR